MDSINEYAYNILLKELGGEYNSLGEKVLFKYKTNEGKTLYACVCEKKIEDICCQGECEICMGLD